MDALKELSDEIERGGADLTLMVPVIMKTLVQVLERMKLHEELLALLTDQTNQNADRIVEVIEVLIEAGTIMIGGKDNGSSE